jgi:hypothetical protein
MPALITLDGTTLPAPPPSCQPTQAPLATGARAGRQPRRPGRQGLHRKDGKTATELAAAPLDALNGLTAAQATALKQALGISTP